MILSDAVSEISGFTFCEVTTGKLRPVTLKLANVKCPLGLQMGRNYRHSYCTFQQAVPETLMTDLKELVQAKFPDRDFSGNQTGLTCQVKMKQCQQQLQLDPLVCRTNDNYERSWCHWERQTITGAQLRLEKIILREESWEPRWLLVEINFAKPVRPKQTLKRYTSGSLNEAQGKRLKLR